MARPQPEGTRTGRAQTIKTYCKLILEKKDLEDKLKKVKLKITTAEPGVLDHFQQMGYQNTNVDGICLHLKRRIVVGKKPGVKPEDMQKALVEAGMGEYVKPAVNSRSLASYYTNVEAALIQENNIPNNVETLLQPEVKDVLNIHEIFSIGARKS